MRVNLKYLIFLTTFFVLAAGAQEDSEGEKLTEFKYTQNIKKQIEEISQIKPENFRREIDKYRDDIQVYFEHKKRVCRGEFSTVILGESEKETTSDGDESSESGSSEGKKKDSQKNRKLTRQERQLCFREMKALQVTFINHMFEARKRYLSYLHDKRLKELEEARKKAVEDLKASFSSP